MCVLSRAGVRRQPLPVDQIAAIVTADVWDWDDARARRAVRKLSEPALTLIGQMYRLWAIHEDEDGYSGMTDPVSQLFNMALAYSRHGQDPAIRARFRDLVDESLHEEQFDRMEATASNRPPRN